MDYSSVQFAMQARSDLGQAQAIARACTSGEALGTAMFLAQQSMEKQFKSTLLRTCEALGVGLDEKFFKKKLNHAVHKHPTVFYQKCLEGIRQPTSPRADKIAERTMGMLKRVGKVWDPGFYDQDIRILLFQCYLEDLPQGDEAKLDAHLAAIFGKINKCDGSSEMPKHKFSCSQKSEPMDAIISDRARLQRLRDGFARMPDNLATTRAVGQMFGNRLDFIRNIAGRRRMSPEATDGGDAALMILDYGALAVAMHSPNYVYLVPHCLLGRYPTRISTGKITTEVYASQRNAVLARLFVNVQYDYDQLCRVNGCIGEMCAAWQGGDR